MKNILRKELEKLLKGSGIKLVKSYYDKGNGSEAFIKLSFECGEIEINFEDEVVTDIAGSGNFFTFKKVNTHTTEIIKFMEEDFLLRSENE